MVRIGESADEYYERRGSESNEVWIKKFKPGETRMRPLQPVSPDLAKDLGVSPWITYRQHYFGKALGYGPCIADPPVNDPSCVGCNSESAQVQSRTRVYVFNALSEQGRVELRQVGAKLKDLFKLKEDRLGSITDRDWVVVRVGQTKDDTVYDLEAGDKYPLEGDVELYDIPAVAGEAYEKIARALKGETFHDDDDGSGDALPEDDGDDVEDDKQDTAPESGYPDFGEMENPEIRDWIKAHGGEAPPRAGRKALVELAKTLPPY